MRTTGINEWQFWSRVIRMAAAVIGAVAALWLLSGDRDPSAMQRIESSLGKTANIPPIVGMTGDPGYTSTLIIEHPDGFDRDGVFFFFLRFPGGDRVVISADDDLVFSQWLAHHIGRKVQIRMEDITMTPPEAPRRKEGQK